MIRTNQLRAALANCRDSIGNIIVAVDGGADLQDTCKDALLILAVTQHVVAQFAVQEETGIGVENA